MASSGNQGEESRTPVSLEDQTPPLPPSQLRHSLSREQPRIRVSPPLSRSFSQLLPSPETVASIEDGSYYKVPSKWCPDNKVCSRDFYLSRNSLLKKMIHQRIPYRMVKPVVHSNVKDEDERSPIDYWVTMPIHPPPIGQENADPPELKNVSLNEIEGISIAFATGPVESSRCALNPSTFEIKYGDLPSVPLTNVENQTPPSDQLQSSGLSPQLRYSQSRKQPRIRVSPPSSRIFRPSPDTLEVIAGGSYNKVPSPWSPDRRVWSRDLYLSRNSQLLKKMIHQRILYRTLDPVSTSNPDSKDKLNHLGIKILGMPMDYWLTMPIDHPPTRLENADPPGLKDASLYEIEGISIAYAIGPLEAFPYAFNRLLGLGQEPEYHDGIPFRWVRNTTGTKIHDRDTIISLNIEHVIGFVQCGNCGGNLCMGYIMPKRIDIVDILLDKIVEQISKYGDRVASKFHVSCRCGGPPNSSKPIISNDLNKINWMFLFLGFGIGFCTLDQLKYYCVQRKLPISDKKEKLLVTVYDDLSLQITQRHTNCA